MIIYFKRSGGFMGRPIEAKLDMTSLPQDEAEDIVDKLMAVRFLDLSNDQVNPPVDRFTYELTVVGNEFEHTIIFSESETPEELDALVRRMTTLARQPAADDLSDTADTNPD